MSKKTISMSRLGSKLKCYNFKWDTSEYAISGRVYHSLLEKVFKKQSLTQDEHKVIYGLLNKFRDNLFLSDSNNILVEKEMYSNELENGYYIHGVADFVQMKGDKALIIDWKTGHRVFEPETVQSLFYSIMIFDNYPEINQVVFSLAFTRYGVVKSLIYTRDELVLMKGEACEYIGEYDEVVKKKELTAGTFCTNCKNRFSCKQVAYKLSPDKDNIMSLIATFKALTEERSKIKELIEHIADTKTDEELKDIGVKFKVKERRTLESKSDAINFVKNLGYDMSQIPLSITLTDIKKLDRSIPKKLEEAGLVKVSTSVSMDM